MDFKYFFKTILLYWLTAIIVCICLFCINGILNNLFNVSSLYLSICGSLFLIINFAYIIGIPSCVHLAISSGRYSKERDFDLRVKVTLISFIICLIIGFFVTSLFSYVPYNDNYVDSPYVQKA